MGSLKKEIEKQKKKDTVYAFWITLIMGVILILGGILYSVKKIVKVGVNLKYLQPTILNAGMLYLFGLVFLVMSFFLYREKKKNR